MAKFALLIGVSDYAEGLNPLPGTQADIVAMQRILEHPDIGGFNEVKSLPNPNVMQMHEAIENLFLDRDRDDLILLYFSGHGVVDGSGTLYFATRETRVNQSKEPAIATTVMSSYVHGIMSNSRSKSKRQVLILDCCFSGAFVKGAKGTDSGLVVDVKELLGGEGRVVLTSSSATQQSFEQENADMSVYTRYLIEGIEKGVADTDNDGWIAVDELHEYAAKKIKEAKPTMTPKIHVLKDEGFKILLAKAPVGDPQVEYRKEVEKCIQDGEISTVGLRILNELQRKLGLSDGVVKAIKQEVLQPYLELSASLQNYEDALIEALDKEGTLRKATKDDLKRYQEYLKLRNEDIEKVEEKVYSARGLKTEPKVSIPTSPGDQLDIPTRSKVSGTDYTELGNLLNSKKWRAADEKTTELMLKVAKREEEGWLDVKAIKKFPIEDLQIIDRLWVKYSGGYYGFSIQKKIWEECGIQNETTNHWEKFGDRVGWRKNGQWLKYDDIISQPEISSSSLPWGRGLGIRWRRQNGISFFSHPALNHSIERELSQQLNLKPRNTPPIPPPAPESLQPPQTLAVGEPVINTKSQTSGTDYTELSNLLRDKQWREADEKTAELMLKIAKREKEGWLDIKAIENFLIEDLQIIDRLWVEYSKGKYGFSVQKKMWKECGSPKEYGKEWEKFGDRVGWRRENKWLDYFSLDFQPNKSPYTLPFTPLVEVQEGIPMWVMEGDWLVGGIFGMRLVVSLLLHPAFKP